MSSGALGPESQDLPKAVVPRPRGPGAARLGGSEDLQQFPRQSAVPGMSGDSATLRESTGNSAASGAKEWCCRTFPTARQLEAIFNGCKNECDQKCVIDNHEVEILQTPVFDPPSMWESTCPSGRAATDLCTPSPVMPAGGGADSQQFGSGFDSQRSQGSHCTPRSDARVPSSGTFVKHG